MSSFCCPICGSPLSDDDLRCNTCDAPLEEIEYTMGKIVRERREPRMFVDFDTNATEPLLQVICPECGTRAGNFYHECHACGFPLRKKIEESYEPVLKPNAGYAERRAVAIDPRASESTLNVLANDALAFVRRGVAANPSAPQDFLISQASNDDASMRAAVAGNPSTPASILEELSRDEMDFIKRQVVLNSSSPESARSEALSTMQRATLEELAKDDSPEWLLNALSNSDDKWVRAKVAANPKCSAAVFGTLSRDQEESVRVEVAKNLSTPQETLVSMAKDASPSVRYELARNAHVPPDIRESISKQEDVAFIARKEITHRAEPPSVEPEKIREHFFSPGRERASIAGCHTTPAETIRALMGQDGAPLEACLRNPATPPDVIREIIERIEDAYDFRKDDQRKYTVARVAGREDLDDETMHLLVTSHHELVRCAVADDPRISDEDLDALSRDSRSRIRAAAARNPKASASMLERLAFDKDENVRLSVLWNPRAPRDLMMVVDSRGFEKVSDVLKARNPDIRPEELERFCPGFSSDYENDQKTLARTEAAQNPAASASLLDILARDSYREVRQAVLRNANAPERVIRVAEANDTPTPLKGRDYLPKKWEFHSEYEDCEWLWSQAVIHANNLSDIDYDFLYGVRKVRQHSYLQTMARHENAPIFIFERIASDTDTIARENLASNRCVPSHVQRDLAFDKSADVRRKLAENDYATPDVLDILSYDVDNWTRREAHLRLRKLLLEPRNSLNNNGAHIRPHNASCG